MKLSKLLSKRQAEVLRDVVHHCDSNDPEGGLPGYVTDSGQGASVRVLSRLGLVVPRQPLGTGWFPTEEGRRVAEAYAPVTPGDAWAGVDRQTAQQLPGRQAEVLRDVVHYCDHVLPGLVHPVHNGYTPRPDVDGRVVSMLDALARRNLVTLVSALKADPCTAPLCATTHRAGWQPTTQGRRVAVGIESKPVWCHCATTSIQRLPVRAPTKRFQVRFIVRSKRNPGGIDPFVVHLPAYDEGMKFGEALEAARTGLNQLARREVQLSEILSATVSVE